MRKMRISVNYADPHRRILSDAMYLEKNLSQTGRIMIGFPSGTINSHVFQRRQKENFYFYIIIEFNSRTIGSDINMAAISLFRGTNMVAVNQQTQPTCGTKSRN